jgi:type II secretory ATPase GspE/PulE/Tfp pilus assembly ATPase PilB-like protein
MVPAPGSRPKLGDILTRLNLIDDEQVKAALDHQADSGKLFGQSLLALGYIAADDLAWALSNQLGLPFVAVTSEMADADLVKTFPQSFLRRSLVLPLVASETELSVVLADPTDEASVARLEYISAKELRLAVGTPQAIERALHAILGEAEAGSEEEGASSAEGGEPAPSSFNSPEVVNLLDRAFAQRAAQIHLDPEGDKVRVRFRDSVGRLSEGGWFEPESLRDLRAGLEISLEPGNNSKEAVQIWTPRESSQEFPFTVVSLAGVESDSITLILDGADPSRSKIAAPFEEEWNRLEPLLSRRSGIILAASPTSLGRQLTLARILGRIDATNRRICVFAPPEIRLPGSMIRLAGGPSAESARAVFGAGGVDMVAGMFESSDGVSPLVETVARSGFCVAAVPGNSAIGVLARALEAGVSPVLLSESLLAVIALRILTGAKPGDGPLAVSEVLFVDPPLRRALQNGGDMDQIRGAARGQGFVEIAARARTLDGVDERTREDLERHRYLEKAA